MASSRSSKDICRRRSSTAWSSSAFTLIQPPTVRKVLEEDGRATVEVGEAEVEVDPELRVLRDLRR